MQDGNRIVWELDGSTFTGCQLVDSGVPKDWWQKSDVGCLPIEDGCMVPNFI